MSLLFSFNCSLIISIKVAGKEECISRCFSELKKNKKIRWILSFVTCTCISALMIWVIIYSASKKQPKLPSPNHVQEWYKKESVYEILIQSFQDSFNNGIGDIKGKMDKNASGMIYCTWCLLMYVSFYHEMFLKKGYTVKHVYSDHAYNEMTLITKH